MRLRIETEPERTHAFLIAYEYPAVWNVASLAEYALILRVEHDDPDIGTIGYLWFTWVPYRDKCLDWHACIAPEWRGKWITNSLFEQVTYIGLLFGATSLSTRTIGDRQARLVAALLRRRFGFVQFEDGVLYKSLEEHDGPFQSNHQPTDPEGGQAP